MVRRVKLEGHVDDPFTRRKTVPKIATGKTNEDEEEEEVEMTTERLLYMEERKKLKAEEEKQKQLQQREDIRRKMEDDDAGLLGKKVGKKALAGSSKASTQDIFNAHNFDLDINVSEIGVRLFSSAILAYLAFFSKCIFGFHFKIQLQSYFVHVFSKFIHNYLKNIHLFLYSHILFIIFFRNRFFLAAVWR